MFGPPTPTRDAEFAAFVRAASQSLSWTALLLSGDRDLAADLVQESLVKSYLAWPRIRHGEALAYTRRVLVNLNVDRLRKRVPPPSEVIERADPYSFETSLGDRDQVVRMLAGLPPQQRRVLVLRYFNDLSEAEVADHLGISVGTVKSAASRGLAALRGHYAPAAGGEQS